MKDLNLVPGFPTGLIKKIMPHQPISIHLNESGVVKHDKGYALESELWEEIKSHVYGSIHEKNSKLNEVNSKSQVDEFAKGVVKPEPTHHEIVTLEQAQKIQDVLFFSVSTDVRKISFNDFVDLCECLKKILK